MTKDQVTGVIDRIVIAVLTYAVARGWVSQGDVAQFGPAIVGLLAAIYGWYVNRPHSILKSAAALPTVDKIVVNNPETAAAIPSEKVTNGH